MTAQNDTFLPFHLGEKGMTRADYSALVKEKHVTVSHAQIVVDREIRRCAVAVGSLKKLSKLTGRSEKQIKAWRDGRVQMKANTAMKFEQDVNAAMDGKSNFRCDRCKLIAWFFVSEVTK